MTESEQPAGRVAKDAAISAIVSESVFIAVAVGLTLWMTHREWLMLQGRRLAALARQDFRGWRAEREIADLRRDISAWEHGEA